MHIRAFDERTDLDGLKRCVVELQDVERLIVPSMPSGAEVCEAYTRYIIGKCARRDGYIVVAVVDDTIVGYASVYARIVSDDIEDGKEPFGLIGDLLVLDACRGRGYGARLMDTVETIARDRGVTTLRIGVLADNAVALDLYTSRGFAPLAIQLEKTLVVGDGDADRLPAMQQEPSR